MWIYMTLYDTKKKYEPAHDKTYNKTCAVSKESDQPAHSRRLIRFFADCMCLPQLPCYPKRDEREPLPYLVDVQANRVFADHTGLIVGFDVR